MPELTIRPAGGEDAEAIAALVQRAYREPDAGGWTTEAHLLSNQRVDSEDLRTRLAAPGYVVLVARSVGGGTEGSSDGKSDGESDGGTEGSSVGASDRASDRASDGGSEGELAACCEIAEQRPGLAYFGMFAVSPQRQSGGIGGQVLAAAEDFARRQWGASQMEMTVIGQRTEMIDWYLRRGYRRTGERRPFPYDEIDDGSAVRDDLYFEVLVKDLVD